MTTGGGDKSVSKKWAKFEICGKFFKTKFALFDKKMTRLNGKNLL